MKQQIGLALLIDGHYDNVTDTENIDFLKQIIYDIAEKMETIVISEVQHQFTPHGITVLAIIADSHIAIHTWPEHQYITIDIFSCKCFIPESITLYLEETLQLKNIQCHEIERYLLN
jgi:S-adenosylmethionine decarboxylase proenzyme